MGGVQRMFYHPFYARFKKHYCPKCETQLELIKCWVVKHSDAPDSANYDFRIARHSVKGYVRFVWDEFKCPKCEFQISIQDMKRREKQNKKIFKRKNAKRRP